MIIFQEDLLECTRPVSQLSHGATVEVDAKKFTTSLSLILFRDYDVAATTGAFASGARGRARGNEDK